MATSATGTCRRPNCVPRTRLAVAPVAMALSDLALTLHGQTREYWAGEYSAALESNPLARFLMESHPVALLGAYVFYLALMVLLVLFSRPATARAWALVFTLGHAFGASTWALRLPGDYVYCAVLWVTARWLYGLGDKAN